MNDPGAPGPGLDWRTPLMILFISHGTATFLMRIVPTLAPILITDYGWTESQIGVFVAMTNSAGVAALAIAGGPMHALGPTRALLGGLFAGGLGVLLLAFPPGWVVIAAAALFGIAHAPTNPAGNDLLSRYAPSGSRALIFSIKQSAPSVGGVLAGLALPVIAVMTGLIGALVFSAALIVIAMLSLIRAHRQLAEPISPDWRHSMSLRKAIAPLGIVLSRAPLRRLAVIGFVLAMVQSVWIAYLSSFLVLELGYAATTAGLFLVVMQVCSVAGRIGQGRTADRHVLPSRLLLAALAASGVITLMLSGQGAGSSWVLTGFIVALGGAMVAGWNGVQMSETVGRVRQEEVFQAVSGMVLVIGAGVATGPLLFAGLLDLVDDWGLALRIVALLPLAVTPLVWWMGRGEPLTRH